jgi:hypothetical protein
MIGSAGQKYLRLRPAYGEVSRDDEAVAAVVARAADDDRATASRASCEERAFEHVGSAAPGILHEHEAGHAAIDGARVEVAHLGSRKDRRHGGRA